MIHILIGILIGILLVQFGLPVLDSLAALIMTILEAAKGYFGIKVAKYNAAMREIMNPKLETENHIIGFTIPEEEELVDEEIL